jgi:hypothetical protein
MAKPIQKTSHSKQEAFQGRHRYEHWQIDNLYEGQNLPILMQRLHGSAAKLVNDLLPERRLEFWRDSKGHEYFDGAIRDEKQGWLAYRYTLFQAVRHGIVRDWREYPHTRINVELETAIQRSLQLNAFLQGVPYKRYQNKSPR